MTIKLSIVSQEVIVGSVNALYELITLWETLRPSGHI